MIEGYIAVMEDAVAQLTDYVKSASTLGNASADHQALAAAQHELDVAIARPLTGREREWAVQTAISVKKLQKVLVGHVSAAEAPGGLISDIEYNTLIVNERVVDLKDNHRNLLKECERLLHDLETYSTDKVAGLTAVRRDLMCLMIDLHHHRAIEADMIFEALDFDIGAVD